MVGTTNNLFGKRGDDTFTVERSGKIMRQAGPPLASAGHVGNIALDVSAATYDVWQKTRPWSGTTFAAVDYLPRGVANDAATMSQVAHGSAETSPWSRIATLPNTAASAMAVKWYGDARFPNTLGAVGDYALYLDGATVREWGPKVSTGWPENGEGGALTQSVITSLTQRGASADGSAIALDTSTLSSSVVDTNFGNVTTTVVSTTTNQATPFVLRGLFGDIASTLGIVTSTIQQRGLETWGHVFPGTVTAPAVEVSLPVVQSLVTAVESIVPIAEGIVGMPQFQLALRASGRLQAVLNRLPADPTSPIAIAWRAMWISPGGIVAVWLRSNVAASPPGPGLSADEVSALFISAQNQVL